MIRKRYPLYLFRTKLCGEGRYPAPPNGGIMNTEHIKFISINQISSDSIQIVTSFRTQLYRNSKELHQMILQIAIDKKKSGSDCCEISVYIPAHGNYKNEQHITLLNLFRAGVPWVPVRCSNFKVFRKQTDNHYSYYAIADSFTVIDYSDVIVSNDL